MALGCGTQETSFLYCVIAFNGDYIVLYVHSGATFEVKKRIVQSERNE
jgi:hypothetical protein